VRDPDDSLCSSGCATSRGTSRPPSRTWSWCATLAAVGLLAELDAFYLDHSRCAELDAGVDGAVVWIACECGASTARRVDEDDALSFDG
jgi:hypothetical protein